MIEFIKHTTKPFTIFGIRGMFDDAEIALIREKFPVDIKLYAAENNEKYSISEGRPEMYSIIKDEFWKKTFIKFTEKSFIKELLDFLQLDSKSGERIAIASINPIVNFFNRIHGKLLVDIRFQFSLMPPGAFIVPHTDSPDKFITLCFYIPDEDQEGNAELGTNFFKPNSEEAKHLNWSNTHLKLGSAEYESFMNDHSILLRPSYTSKEIVGFIKNENSWHSVDAVKLPVGESRKSLNINFNYYRGRSKLQVYFRSLLSSFKRYKL